METSFRIALGLKTRQFKVTHFLLRESCTVCGSEARMGGSAASLALPYGCLPQAVKANREGGGGRSLRLQSQSHGSDLKKTEAEKLSAPFV